MFKLLKALNERSLWLSVLKSSNRPSSPSHMITIWEFGKELHLTTVAASHGQRFVICDFPCQLPTIKVNGEDGREDCKCSVKSHSCSLFSWAAPLQSTRSAHIPQHLSTCSSHLRTLLTWQRPLGAPLHQCHSSHLSVIGLLASSWDLQLSASFFADFACWKLQGGPHLMTRTAITKWYNHEI